MCPRGLLRSTNMINKNNFMTVKNHEHKQQGDTVKTSAVRKALFRDTVKKTNTLTDFATKLSNTLIDLHLLA